MAEKAYPVELEDADAYAEYLIELGAPEDEARDAAMGLQEAEEERGVEIYPITVTEPGD